MKPERTAIARRMLSRPTWEYVTRGVLRESDRVLDYGWTRARLTTRSTAVRFVRRASTS